MNSNHLSRPLSVIVHLWMFSLVIQLEWTSPSSYEKFSVAKAIKHKVSLELTDQAEGSEVNLALIYTQSSSLSPTIAAGDQIVLDIKPGAFADFHPEYTIQLRGQEAILAESSTSMTEGARLSFYTYVPGLYDVKIEASFFRKSESTQTTHSTLKNALVYRHNLNVSQRLFDEYPGFADGHACPDNFWTKENCSKGYWVPYHSSVNELPENTVSRLAKQARLPGLWYSGCCRSRSLWWTKQASTIKDQST